MKALYNLKVKTGKPKDLDCRHSMQLSTGYVLVRLSITVLCGNIECTYPIILCSIIIQFVVLFSFRYIFTVLNLIDLVVLAFISIYWVCPQLVQPVLEYLTRKKLMMIRVEQLLISSVRIILCTCLLNDDCLTRL